MADTTDTKGTDKIVKSDAVGLGLARRLGADQIGRAHV